MELTSKRKQLIKEIALLALSFIIPFCLLLIVMQVNKVALFDYSGRTIVMMDMKSEYVAYMSNLKYILENGGSSIYSTSKVFGGDYMSIYTFYLASPFNLFIVFCEYEAIPLFFVWSSIFKMSFAALNMYLFARLSRRFSYSNIIPAIGYGLISYSFIYMSNYMWLDGVMILPLVILGLHYLKDKKHLWLYPLALGYSLLTSWYIGFMICVFVVFYFFVLFFNDFKLKNKANYLFLLRFAVLSLLGGMISAVWWFTAFIHLSGTKGTTAFPNFYNFSISMFLSGFLENNYSSPSLITQYHSYISMFVGMVPLVFAITYFFNGKFTLKERLLYLGLFLVYFVCSMNSVLTALLHGGREPTWFPGRYSFVIGFLVCVLASKSLDEAHELKPIYYLAPLVMGIITLFIVAKVKHSDRLLYYPISVISCVLYFSTILAGVGYSFFSYYTFDNKVLTFIKKYSIGFLALLVIFESLSSYRGADKVISTNASDAQFTAYSTFLKDTNYIQSFDALKTYDKENGNSPFYRMEATFNRPGNYNNIDNNPMFYNYSGLSNFSSSSKKEVESYLLKVGFHYNGFFAKYDGGSTYAMNSLFGIKYLVEDHKAAFNIHPYFLDYNTFNKIDINEPNGLSFYQNDYATSLAFQSDKTSSHFINEGRSLSDSYVYWFDKFEYQNSMFRTLDRSLQKDVFYPLRIRRIDTSIPYTEDEGGLRTYQNVKSGDTISIAFEVPIEGYNYPLYFSEKDYNGEITYRIDSKKYEINTYWHKGIYSFPDNETHFHTLDIRFNRDYSSIKLRPELYYENTDITKEYLTSAKKDELVVDKISSTLTKYIFDGHVDLSSTANKDLVFTIPYEKEIHVKVDGKEVEVYKKYNIFSAIDLSSLEVGNHKVSIYYDDGAMKVGYVMAGVGFVLLVPFVLFYNRIESFLFYRRKEEEISE